MLTFAISARAVLAQNVSLDTEKIAIAAVDFIMSIKLKVTSFYWDHFFILCANLLWDTFCLKFAHFLVIMLLFFLIGIYIRRETAIVINIAIKKWYICKLYPNLTVTQIKKHNPYKTAYRTCDMCLCIWLLIRKAQKNQFSIYNMPKIRPNTEKIKRAYGWLSDCDKIIWIFS